MFRVRGVTYEDKYQNLRSILSSEEDYEANINKIGSLPSNTDVLESLKGSNSQESSIMSYQRPKLQVFLNSLIITLWVENNANTWYLGYIFDLGNDDSHKVTVDHLHRVHKSGHHLWEYPKKPDLCEVDLLQVLGIEPQYQWQLENLRNHKMELKNF